MRKYGLENFTFEVLQDNIETFEKLDKAEIYWIDYYNSFVKGYNETFGGQQYHKILPNKEIIEDYYKTKSAFTDIRFFDFSAKSTYFFRTYLSRLPKAPLPPQKEPSSTRFRPTSGVSP